MMHLHQADPKARHGRMFELLRQSYQAEITAARLGRPQRMVDPGSSAEAFRRLAVQSLHRMEPDRVIAVADPSGPGRLHADDHPAFNALRMA